MTLSIRPDRSAVVASAVAGKRPDHHAPPCSFIESYPPTAHPLISGLLRLAEEEDPVATEAVTRQARAIGRGLRLIAAALSPELILITGEITSAWPRFGPVIQRELELAVLAGPPPRLETAGDGESARLRGAAAVLLQRHAGYHHSTHNDRRLPLDAIPSMH